MEYYLGIKRNKLLVNETTWMDFKSTVLSERASENKEEGTLLTAGWAGVYAQSS